MLLLFFLVLVLSNHWIQSLTTTYLTVLDGHVVHCYCENNVTRIVIKISHLERVGKVKKKKASQKNSCTCRKLIYFVLSRFQCFDFIICQFFPKHELNLQSNQIHMGLWPNSWSLYFLLILWTEYLFILLCKFQVYSFVIWHLWTLQSDHPHQSNYHPAPCSWPPIPKIPSPLVTINLFSVSMRLFLFCLAL